MRIIVCIKQVPATNEVKIDPKTGTLIREGIESIINPFDLFALEEGLRLKEAHGGCVFVLSMGPLQARISLKEAMAMGADTAVLLSDRAFAGSDTLATSYTLAAGIKKLGGADIILCGKQSTDGETGQVGPGIAAQLDIPHITCVTKIIKVDHAKKRIVVEREVEEGYEEILTTLPVLLTVEKEINRPRFLTVKGIMRAKKTGVVVWTASDLEIDPSRIGLSGSPTEIVKVFSLPRQKRGIIFSGTPEEQVETLVSKLKEAGYLF
ncbi:MAG: hypothetical protein PWP65_637 [Clostridia bacterium]|nr:hypothetical protein [Clostridia bacterium]